jgi:hypothetical protein
MLDLFPHLGTLTGRDVLQVTVEIRNYMHRNNVSCLALTESPSAPRTVLYGFMRHKYLKIPRMSEYQQTAPDKQTLSSKL